MSSQEEVISLVKKKDRWGIAFFIIMALAGPIYVAIEGMWALVPILLVLLTLPYVVAFWHYADAITKSIVVTPDRIRLIGRNGEIWMLKWSHVKAVYEPPLGGIYRRFEFDVAGRDERLSFPAPGQGLERARIRSVIEAHLPPGVEILVEIQGLSPNRSRYLAIGVAGLAVGALLLWLTFSWIATAYQPASWRAELAIYTALASMIAFGIGVVQLGSFVAWKPTKTGRKQVRYRGLEESLQTALTMLKRSEKVPTTLRFAYKDEHKRFDLQKQSRLALLCIVGLSAFLLIMLLLAARDKTPNPRITHEEQMRVLAGMVLLLIALLSAMTWAWYRGLKRLVPHLDLQVLLEDGQMYVLEGEKRTPAQILVGTKLLTSRDSSGLNSSAMKIEYGGQTAWIDPISMRRI